MSTVERDPALRWNPLPEHGSQAIIVPRQWIIHTFVDSVKMTTDKMQDYFEFSSNLESHTILGWSEHQQIMDFDRQADANYKANRFQVPGDPTWYGAISTETEDDGDPEGKPWNAYQVKELIREGVWLNKTFGIPPELPKVWNGSGMGYHSLYPMIWTPYRGKTCPGFTRIKQFKEIVLPGIRSAIATPPSEEDELVLTYAYFSTTSVQGSHCYSIFGNQAVYQTDSALKKAQEKAAFFGKPLVLWSTKTRPLTDLDYFGSLIFMDGPLKGK